MERKKYIYIYIAPAQQSEMDPGLDGYPDIVFSTYQ